MSYKSVNYNYNSNGSHVSTTYRYGCKDGTKMTYTHPVNRSNYNRSSKTSSRKYYH